MAPSISPLQPGQPSYTIQQSTAFITGFTLDIQATETKTLKVTYPPGLAGRSFKLVHIQRVPPPLVRTQLTLPGNGSLSHYDISAAESTLANGLIELDISITENGGGTNANETWELQTTADTPATWTVTPDSIGGLVIDWVACDPVAELTVAPNVFEGDFVTLHADTATTGTLVPVPPFPPDPKVPVLTPSYTWTHVSGAIPLNELEDTTPGPSKVIHPPGVYEPIAAGLTVTTKFADTNNLYTDLLSNTSTVETMTVSQRPQLVVLVIDRSGSMGSESRYENAKIACRSLIHLFHGLRKDVNAGDRVAIVAFEDDLFGFRAGDPSPRIQTLLDLSTPEAAVAAVDNQTIDFGAPGANTPIGDGLLFAIDLLVKHAPVVNQRYNIILLTDGEQNSGHTTLDPDLATNGAIAFTDALTDARKAVLKETTLSAIALGATADQNLLGKLATVQVRKFEEFSLVLNAGDLAEKFGRMLANAQAVDAPIKTDTAPPEAPDDDVPAKHGVYFLTDADVDRLVLSVTPPEDQTAFTGTIQLARFNGSADTGSYVPVPDPPAHILSSPSDRATSVAKLPDFGNHAPIRWRVIHGPDPTSTEALDPKQVLAYLDLHLRADVLLDQPTYRTGDRITLTVRIRHDTAAVLGATIRAELTAPGVGLGEELSALAAVPAALSADSEDQPGQGRDRPTWRERRIGDLLRHHNWHTLPQTQPTGLFVDGTDQLFDPEGDGNYTNVFAQVFKEGTYLFKLFIDGLDANGNPFTRSLEISTFASIKVDPKATTTKVSRVHNHPSGLLAARVVITPQDKRHERLGPGKDNQVIWALRDGTFEHVLQHVPAPVFTDGTYQRVVLYQPKQHPTIQVKAAGVLLPEFDVRKKLLGLGLLD